MVGDSGRKWWGQRNGVKIWNNKVNKWGNRIMEAYGRIVTKWRDEIKDEEVKGKEKGQNETAMR